MRILSVTPYAPPHIGGLEALVDSLAVELTRRGHDVTVVTSPAGWEDGFGTPGRPPSGYRVVYVPAAYRFLQTRMGVPYPLFAPALYRVLAREIANADVVHAHGFLFHSTVAALSIARRARNAPPRILTEHVGHVPYSNRVLDRAQALAIATIGRWSARDADAVVVYNRSVEATVARIAPGSRIEWIDNGVDTSFFRPAQEAERAQLRHQLGWDERPRVLFGGRAVAKKGPDVAVEAARVGDGAFVLAVVGAIAVPDGAPNVERLGLLPRDRMAAALRCADAPAHALARRGPAASRSRRRLRAGCRSSRPTIPATATSLRASVPRFACSRPTEGSWVTRSWKCSATPPPPMRPAALPNWHAGDSRSRPSRHVTRGSTRSSFA